MLPLCRYFCKMKHFFRIALLCLGAFSGCSDGDLSIERITFSGEQVYACSGDISTHFLYKTQGKQALLLTFNAGTLTNNPNEEIIGQIPTQFKLYYRTLSDAPTQAYFCSFPPVSSPVVQNEIQAKGGTVQIVTKEIQEPDGSLRYDHLITIKDLQILNEQGERLIETEFIFGTYKTQ